MNVHSFVVLLLVSYIFSYSYSSSLCV